jgi:hypothetical protein
MEGGRVNLLTASRLTTHQRCARAHQYRYELGLSGLTTAFALLFGTAIHAALEAFWRAWMANGYGSTEQALDALNSHASTDSKAGLDPFALAKARVMVAAYCARYTRLAARSEVLAVEQEFRAPLIDPDTGVDLAAHGWQLGGKVDAIIRMPDGRVAIVEHKSAGRDASAGSDYRARLTLDAQVGLYYEGAAALGFAADLCLYDVLVKPAQEPFAATPEADRRYTKASSKACKGCARKKDAQPAPHIDHDTGLTCDSNGRIVTDPGGALYASMRAEDETVEAFEARLFAAIEADPDRYLIQAEIVRTDEERADCRRDAVAVVRVIEIERRRGYAARSAQACFAHGRCDYLDACLYPSSVDDPHRFRRLPVIHPELAHESNDNDRSPTETETAA